MSKMPFYEQVLKFTIHSLSEGQILLVKIVTDLYRSFSVSIYCKTISLGIESVKGVNSLTWS